MAPEPLRHGLRVDQYAIGQPEDAGVQSTLERRAQVPEVALAGDDGAGARQARRENAHDVAVEVEGMDEDDALPADVAHELDEASERSDRPQRASTTAPRANAGGVE